MKKPWSYLINPFLVVLQFKGFAKVLGLSTFHDSRLSAATSTPLVALYTAYHPIHLALVAAYDAWQQYKGIQKGTTAGATQTRKQITAKVNEWDRSIQQVFIPGTPEYIMLFPKGHMPFLRGKQQAILSAVKGLSDTLASYPKLGTVKANVDGYYNTLSDTNNSKNTAKGTTDQYGATLETAAAMACRQMFLNLCDINKLFVDDLQQGEEYFDMTILRDESQTVFTKTVSAGDIHPIVQRTLAPDAQIRIRNTGKAPLVFFIAGIRHHDHGTMYAEVAAGDEQTVSASQLGNVPADKWLSVHNEALADGSFELELL